MHRRLFEADAAAKQKGALTAAATTQTVGPVANLLQRMIREGPSWPARRVSHHVAGSMRNKSNIARPERGPLARRGVEPALALGHEMETRFLLRRKIESPGTAQLAATIRHPGQPQILENLAQRIDGRFIAAVGRTVKHFRQTIMECSAAQPHMRGYSPLVAALHKRCK